MNKCRKRILSLVLVVCLTAGLTGCTTYTNFKNAFFGTDTVAKEKTIKIGVFEPTSGSMKTQGKEEVMGIELAHDLYPTACGKTVELVYADNKSDMYEAEAAIQELISSSSPSMILGSYGETLSLIAGKYIEAANIPSITISSTNPLITANNPYYFSATYSEARQGDALADFAYLSQNKDMVATVKLENDDTATATIKRFTNRMKKLTENNRCVVGSFTLSTTSADYTETIEKIRESGATAVFLAVPPTVAKDFLTQAQEQKLPYMLFLGTRSWGDKDFLEFVKANKQLHIGYPAEQATNNETAMSQKFMEAFRTKYGEDAELSQRTVVAFDAYLLAVTAMDRAMQTVRDTDPDTIAQNSATDAEARAKKEAWQVARETGIPSGTQIKDALNGIDNFEGASGVINYKGKNEATKSVSISHIANGTELPAYVSES
ncbi:MAG: ABC transporter substrate-binding protein [Clostridia bacterium]